MAFHLQCKPEAFNNPAWAIFESKYDDSTCKGCSKQINIGDKIAYYRKNQAQQAGTAPGGADAAKVASLAQELAQLKKDIIDLKNSTRRHGDLISGCVSESISLHRFLKDKGIVPAKDVNQLVAKTQETSMEEAAAVMGGSVVNLNGAAEDVY